MGGNDRKNLLQLLHEMVIVAKALILGEKLEMQRSEI